jgi:hypothetical protein
MIPEAQSTPVSDKSRMLPSPPGLRAAGAPRERERETERLADDGSYRDRQRDLTRDLARDLPRETPHDDRGQFGPGHGRDDYSQAPVTREISRETARDMGRDMDRRDAQLERRETALDRREPSLDRREPPPRETRERRDPPPEPRGRGFDPGPSLRHDDIAFETKDDAPPAQSPARGRGRERPEPRKSGGMAAYAGLLALVLFAGAAVWGVLGFREQIVSAAPWTASLYEPAGYKVNARGLDFADISYAREIDNGVTVLAIRGQIVNVSDREVPVPKVRVTVRDADKRDLYQWTFEPETQKLNPRGRAPFATRLESPPPDAWDLEIRFAKAGE